MDPVIKPQIPKSQSLKQSGFWLIRIFEGLISRWRIFFVFKNRRASEIYWKSSSLKFFSTKLWILHEKLIVWEKYRDLEPVSSNAFVEQIDPSRHHTPPYRWSNNSISKKRKNVTFKEKWNNLNELYLELPQRILSHVDFLLSQFVVSLVNRFE